jgi:dUTP pyrophosphatase
LIKWHALYDDAIIPTRATKRSAGYDMYAQHGAVIQPGKWGLVKTGVTIEINELVNAELQVRPRSGLALKHGVTVLNAPGTVDADYYPNDIGVVLMNCSENPFIVNQGDRIAQGVIAEYFTAFDDESKAVRDGGFGHTGV